MGHTTQAVDAKAILKQVVKELRQAEKDMFAGKTDKAISALEPIKGRLIELKAADPNNPGLKTAENKYKKLVKDLERRTGKDLGGGTLTAAGASTQTALPPKPDAKAMPEKAAPAPATGDAKTVAKDVAAPATGAVETVAKETAAPAQAAKAAASTKLPNDAKRPLREATSQISRIDGNIERLNDPKSGFNKEQRFFKYGPHIIVELSRQSLANISW